MNTKRVTVIAIGALMVALCTSALCSSSAAFRAQIAQARAVMAARDGRYREALAEYDRELALDPRLAASVAVGKASVYAAVGEYDLALSQCNLAIAVSPQEPPAYLTRAAVYLGKKDYQAAIEDCSRIISASAAIALGQAYFIRGTAYANMDNFTEAIKDFTYAIILSTHKAEPYASRAMAYGSVGNYDDAIADFSRAISLDRRRAAYYYNRGLSYEAAGMKPEAVADFRKFISLTDDSEWATKAAAKIDEIQGGG